MRAYLSTGAQGKGKGTDDGVGLSRKRLLKEEQCSEDEFTFEEEVVVRRPSVKRGLHFITKNNKAKFS